MFLARLSMVSVALPFSAGHNTHTHVTTHGKTNIDESTHQTQATSPQWRQSGCHSGQAQSNSCYRPTLNTTETWVSRTAKKHAHPQQVTRPQNRQFGCFSNAAPLASRYRPALDTRHTCASQHTTTQSTHDTRTRGKRRRPGGFNLVAVQVERGQRRVAVQRWTRRKHASKHVTRKSTLDTHTRGQR